MPSQRPVPPWRDRPCHRWARRRRLSTRGLSRARFSLPGRDEWRAEHVKDAVLLGVSELVTNAVVHAGSHAELALRLADGVLRVEVRDLGQGTVSRVRREATVDDLHGRGLLLVEALSSAWGVTEDPDGKTVWFEVVTTDA